MLCEVLNFVVRKRMYKKEGYKISLHSLLNRRSRKKSLLRVRERKKIDRHDLVLFYFLIFLMFLTSSYIRYKTFVRGVFFCFSCFTFFLAKMYWLNSLFSSQKKHPINFYFTCNNLIVMILKICAHDTPDFDGIFHSCKSSRSLFFIIYTHFV